jgi:anti-anti-sigma regulatory factor
VEVQVADHGARVLVLIGEFDGAASAPLLIVAHELALMPCSDVRIDASGVTVASAALLDALEAVRLAVLQGCGTFTVTATSSSFHCVVELTGADGLEPPQRRRRSERAPLPVKVPVMQRLARRLVRLAPPHASFIVTTPTRTRARTASCPVDQLDAWTPSTETATSR